MLRLGAIFVAVCMVLISGSFGSVLYLWFGLTGAESLVVAIALLTALAVYDTVSTRLRERSDDGAQIAALSGGTADLARQVADLTRQVAELGRRLAMVETPDPAVDRAAAAATPLDSEIGELGALVKQLAEAVALHDATLHSMAASGVAAPASGGAPAPAPVPAPVADTVPGAARDAAAASGRFQGIGREAMLAMLREAVEADRIDLHLQPIVSLPQRKVRYYEALARLRGADGETIGPADFLPDAETHGLMPRLDTGILFRCVQVLRRLHAKNRDVGVFCNLSPATLSDSRFFPRLQEFIEANRTLAAALVFELTQASYRSLGPIEIESLAVLKEAGFRFSMDQVEDLRVEPRDLAERGFRFVKVPAALLLDRTDPAASDIYPADFSALLARFKIEMIAEKIETEAGVVDLIDYDVKFGQGFLFGSPRPVRPEVMQGIADSASAGRETVVAPARPAVVPAPAVDSRPAPRVSALAQLARGMIARG